MTKMTSRERWLTVMKGGIPDCVPVAPDFSNMIPARMTSRERGLFLAMDSTAREE